jgi:hypothetical protein
MRREDNYQTGHLNHTDSPLQTIVFGAFDIPFHQAGGLILFCDGKVSSNTAASITVQFAI